MKHDVKKYLFDIKISIESISEYIGEEKDFKSYLKNKLLRRAVEREIEIIGEAMKQVLSIEPQIGIESARKIVDTRNWVIHSYDTVDDVIIWGIVSKHLPKLEIEIKDILENE
ncbi:MAG: DUF86 domain-containing protein [Cytophagales bacterium]|nr:DUF86 domain-containing protein [Cytophagales bacterium]